MPANRAPSAFGALALQAAAPYAQNLGWYMGGGQISGLATRATRRATCHRRAKAGAFFSQTGQVLPSAMALIWLPDSCDLPNSGSKRKRRVGGEGDGAGEPVAVAKAKKTASVASMSSTASLMSRASFKSTASSNSSFARRQPSEEDESGIVRIAIGGL